jgi:hypothetical protein
MKKMFRLLPLFYLFHSCTNAAAQEYKYPYSFFTNSIMKNDYFFSRAEAYGGSAILNSKGKLPVTDRNFHTPGNSLVLQYSNATNGKWSASVFMNETRGMDHFIKASSLSFWIYSSAVGTTPGDLPKVQLMKRDSTLTAAMELKNLNSRQWQQIILPLNAIEGFDPGNPAEFIGVVFFVEGGNGGVKHLLYIDDIEFTDAENVANIAARPYISSTSSKFAKHVDITWPAVTDKNVRFVKIFRSVDGVNFTPVAVQQPYINRYADFTGETGKKYFYAISLLNRQYRETARSSAVGGATKAMTDNDLLSMVQEAGFRYYWEAAETHSGLAKENIHGRQNMIAAGASGFGIMALIVGAERKFISRKEAVERFVKIVAFLERADRFHGAFPHFIDGPTGKVEPFFGSQDNGADLVETAFMVQGLIAAMEYFSGDDPDEKLIREKIKVIWENIEWDWFRQYADSKFLYWHWSPDQGWVINHPLIGWNETMIVYLLAIASPTHAVSPSMYYSGWANQDSTGRQYRSGWSRTKEGSMYTNGNTYFGIKLDVGVSSGGPLFFTHYSFMGYDPHFITDKYTNYFKNNRNIALINYRYCVANPKQRKGYGEDAWGLTASDGPFGYSADDPTLLQDHGKITPTGAISSFPYTPQESMKALKNYYYNCGQFLWGEYGFRDSFDPGRNWCSEIFMGLNQAPMTVMIENYRTGLIWKLFMKNPDIKRGLEKLNSWTLSHSN